MHKASVARQAECPSSTPPALIAQHTGACQAPCAGATAADGATHLRPAGAGAGVSCTATSLAAPWVSPPPLPVLCVPLWLGRGGSASGLPLSKEGCMPGGCRLPDAGPSRVCCCCCWCCCKACCSALHSLRLASSASVTLWSSCWEWCSSSCACGEGASVKHAGGICKEWVDTIRRPPTDKQQHKGGAQPGCCGVLAAGGANSNEQAPL